MRSIQRTLALAFVGTAWLVGSCRDGSNNTPTAPNRLQTPEAPRADVIPNLDPFTYRAAIDPYKILRLPDFMIQERARTDIVMQRSVLAPGTGPWHRNTGPSFVYVVQGQIKLQVFSDKSGCSYTQVRTAGEVYFIEADQIYRAVVVSSENVVLMVTRFDVPVGGAIQVPVSDPGC